MKNWKTSLTGLLIGVPVAIDALIQAYNLGTFSGKTGLELLVAVGLVLLGLFTKDHNVTGGTIVNSPSDSSVVKETTKKDVE